MRLTTIGLPPLTLLYIGRLLGLSFGKEVRIAIQVSELRD